MAAGAEAEAAARKIDVMEMKEARKTIEGAESGAVRTLLWDRGRFWDEIATALEASGALEIVYRISWEGRGDAHANEFYSGEFCPDRLTGSALPFLEELKAEFSTFAEMNWRNFDFDVTHLYAEKTLDDHLDLFHLYADYFCNLLRERSIELVLFNRPGHLGADYLLYLIARRLGIRTVVLFQIVIPGTFLICDDMDDFGKTAGKPVITERERVPIEKKHKKELFYLHRPGLLEDYRKLVRVCSGGAADAEAGAAAFLNPFNAGRFVMWKMENRPWSLLLKDLARKRSRGQAIFRYRREVQYRRDLAAAAADDTVDLEKPFVYFPLHMQPEATTSAIGGEYLDQLLAVERLARWLPDDWTVLVKENGAQTSYMRGPGFFRRLRLLEKVRLIYGKFDTTTLTEKSKFVATITGTVGWEAITGGKCAVVFGSAWYRELPGVFQFSEDLDLDDVLHCEIVHEDLEEAVQALLARSGEGVIYESYVVQLEEFDAERNADKVARALVAYLRGGKVAEAAVTA